MTDRVFKTTTDQLIHVKQEQILISSDQSERPLPVTSAAQHRDELCNQSRVPTQPRKLSRTVYISSAWAGLVGSGLPVPVTDLRPIASCSLCPATTAELFPDWLPSGTVPSKPVFSGVSIGSWRMSVPSAGPDWLSSDLVSSDGGEESDWTGGLFPSSSVGREEEGSVRMFLEITRMTEDEIFTLRLYHWINQNRLNVSDVILKSLD